MGTFINSPSFLFDKWKTPHSARSALCSFPSRLCNLLDDIIPFVLLLSAQKLPERFGGHFYQTEDNFCVWIEQVRARQAGSCFREHDAGRRCFIFYYIFFLIFFLFFCMQLKPNDVFRWCSPNAPQVVFTRSLGSVCNCAPCDLNTYLSIPWRHPCSSKAMMEFCTISMDLIKGTVCSFREENVNQKSKTN